MSSRGRCRVLRRGTAVGVPGGGMASCGAGRAPAVMEPRFSGGVGKRGLGWCDANRIESTPPQCVSATAFQSSPGPKAGRYRPVEPPAPLPRRVSILARPGGRALRGDGRDRDGGAGRSFNPRPARRPGAPLRSRNVPVSSIGFQSSPGPKAGRSPRKSRPPSAPSRCFNPRPARRPGAPRAERRRGVRQIEVSILARPEGRALRYRALVLDQPALAVSILARPEGRALPARRRPAGSPGHRGFNPRPARRPGAPLADLRGVLARHRVSILARPEGRALLYVPHQNGARALHSRRFPAIRGAVCTRRTRSARSAPPGAMGTGRGAGTRAPAPLSCAAIVVTTGLILLGMNRPETPELVSPATQPAQPPVIATEVVTPPPVPAAATPPPPGARGHPGPDPGSGCRRGR